MMERHNVVERRKHVVIINLHIPVRVEVLEHIVLEERQRGLAEAVLLVKEDAQSHGMELGACTPGCSECGGDGWVDYRDPCEHGNLYAHSVPATTCSHGSYTAHYYDAYDCEHGSQVEHEVPAEACTHGYITEHKICEHSTER